MGGPVEGVESGGASHALGGAGAAAWGAILHGCFSALHAVHALLWHFKRAMLCCICAEITSAATQAMLKAVHRAEVDRAALGRPGTLWLARFARFCI